MTTPKLRTPVRQDQILQAALALIAEEGLPGLSIARLADRVGLVPSAIYRHFENKDRVIAAVLERVRENLLRFVAEARSGAADPIECLRRLLFRHLRFVRENLAVPRLVFSEEVFHGNPEHRERAHGIVTAYLGEVEEILREGQGSGAIRSGLDPAALSRIFLGLIVPAVVLWRLSGGRFDLEAHAESGWALFRRLIAGEILPRLEGRGVY